MKSVYGTDHYSEHERDQENRAATDKFSAILAEAIDAGLEHPLADVVECIVERVTPLALFRAPVEAPPPCREVLRYKPSREEWRRDFADALRARLAPRSTRPSKGHFTLMDLDEGDCRYPLGNGPFLFCGDATAGNQQYCETHFTRCWRGGTYA